jgi:hypothetical protein
MNAVISANTLDWRSSSAFNKAFSIDGFDADAVLEFNSRATFDPQFKAQLRDDFDGVLRRLDLKAIDAREVDASWQERLTLADDEYVAIDEITRKVSGRGIAGNMALERSTTSMGVGVPAVAILILIVVVLVATALQHSGGAAD